jgi:hypothetical protein
MGPSLFGSDGTNRFGLAHLRQAELQPLPSFQGEDLDPGSSGGDLCVQACADDPQVAFHAIHVLSRIASSAATLRYTQQGFGRTSSTSRSQGTPRNLMGFKDGTDDIRAEETGAMNDFVWVQPGDRPGWMTASGGLRRAQPTHPAYLKRDLRLPARGSTRRVHQRRVLCVSKRGTSSSGHTRGFASLGKSQARGPAAR